MRKILLTLAATAVLASPLALAASANAYTLDAAPGLGFVGKGEVQTVLNLNNNQIQGLDVAFTQKSTTEQSFAWNCVKTTVTGNGTVKETTQERANVTTTNVTAVIDSIARVKKQETGYNLIGVGETTTTTVVDGPTPLSCPAASSGYVLDTDSVATGEPTVTNAGLFANGQFVPQVVAPVLVP
jgi:hypothetical protein